ncbi:TonB-dependent siderophore receptor [Leptothermofonsia sp. ETS-13]|uniref:TonB-dependent siderophore receptor n=1 Tax=Leptothermofonsia sp. ETS-13 TaxID=3035696 RepID=UPI003B9ED7DB
MNRWHLGLGIAIASILSVNIEPGIGREVAGKGERKERDGTLESSSELSHSTQNSKLKTQNSITPVFRTLDLRRPATTVKDWLAQIQQRESESPVQVTGVRLNSTEKGLEIVLETEGGRSLQIDATKFRSEGNSLIADIPNATLVLSDTQEFSADNPTKEIANVRVTQIDSANIQVRVIGEKTLPREEVILRAGALAYSLNPEGEEPDEEIVVTGEGQRGYFVPDTSTATRTDTPIRDIPASIQIIPEQILEDQRATGLRDALRNVSGVVEGGNFGGTLDSFIIRGFSATVLRNGLRGTSFGAFAFENALNDIANLDRIEVLKGPASILYGNAEPGGIINLVSKQPLSQPYYSFDLQVGSFGFVRPAVDLSGPLTSDKSVLYRFNAAFQSQDGFRDFDQEFQRRFFSPVLTWKISEKTTLTAELAYLWDERPMDRGLVAFGRGVADIPITRNLGELDDVYRVEELAIRYQFEHQFSNSLKLRNSFQYLVVDGFDYKTQAGTLDEQTGIMFGREFDSNNDVYRAYSLQTDLTAKFATGSVQHTLIVGVDLGRQDAQGTNRGVPDGETPDINIFDPVYRGKPDRSTFTNLRRDSKVRADGLGIFLQDQITLLDNLKLLIGGRFDLVDQKNDDRLAGTVTTQFDQAFTPRVGLVYQPIPPISLYASYGRSFNPNFATGVDGSILEPERGNQLEVGVKAELNKRLSATLAAYRLTKTNIATTDPANPDFSVPIGEIRSRGIEFDIAGEILPGWNIIAGYALSDSVVTESNDTPTGLRTALVPYNAASLWTTYEIQTGDLKGLGFGLGLFYVGDRPGDFDNSYELPAYLRTDAAIYYKHNNWRAAINIKNLANVRYFESVNFGRSTIQPGAPLTVVGSFAIEF